MKKWIPMLAGLGVGTALASYLFQLETRPTQDTFIEAPLMWVTALLQRSIPPLRRFDFGALFVVLWFLFWPCLGALLGWLLGWSVGRLRRPRAHDAPPPPVEQTSNAKGP